MSTTATHGSEGYVELQLPGGSTWIDISDKVHNASLAFSRETAETSTFGTKDKSYVPGLRDATLSIDYYTDDNLRGYLFDCWLNSGTCKLRLGPDGNDAGKERLTAEFLITSFGDGGSISSVVGGQAQFQRTGGVTRDTWA